jgi:hypothetical protein
MRQFLSKSGFAGIGGMILVVLFLQTAWSADFERRDITFKSRGLSCAGWYYVPKDIKPGEKLPAIVMAPGWSQVKETYLGNFASKFAEAGFAVLVFDYRYFGASEGEPRGQLFYYEQHHDYRNAITWMSLQQEVDPARIGIWGTSYSGAHVLHLAAFDKRIKAVVSQVPATNAWETRYQHLEPDRLAARFMRFASNRKDEYAKGSVNHFPVVAPDGQPSTMPQKGSYEFFMEGAKRAKNWKNQITMESLEINMEYAPTAYIRLITPTPLLMIIANDDIVCPVEQQKKAYEQAKEPKKLTVVKGGHFDIYREDGFSEASAAATAWFKQYLMP